MVRQGHLDNLESARLARRALEQTLRETSTSPMMGLARGVVASSHHVLRMLRRAQRDEEDEEIAEKRSMLQQRWDELRDHLIELATRYDTHYTALRRADRKSGETPPST